MSAPPGGAERKVIAMDLTERTLESRRIFEGKIVTLLVDQAQLPDGKQASREVVLHPGGVAVLPLDGEGNVTLVQQYRYPFHQVILELPAGKLDAGEPHETAARRELSEETGLEAEELIYLGCLLASPGFCNERLHLYLARGLSRADSHPDDDEFLNVVTMPFDRLLEQVMDGTIEDAKTVAGVLKTKGLLKLEGGGNSVGKTILIVEDEQNIVDILSFNLSREGYDTLEAYDGRTGLQLALEQSPDLILLDLMLPEMNGFDVCRKLREAGSAVPILMLTAREEETDKVLGLELGADDYITKPFAMRELMARVKANIRRVDMAPAQSAPSAGETEKRLELGRVSIDLDGATVFKDGKPLDLTQREYELIRFLASQPGKVFSREALMEHVWNYEGYVGDVRAVDVAVRRLREKLEDDPAAPKFILTKRGMGYLFGSQPG